MKNAEKSYNTNLAAEYYVMSLLSRLGKDAYLSLGNKKGVDIVVKTSKGAICVLEVKGNSKQQDWLLTNSGSFYHSPELFYALICFNGTINEINSRPDIWIIPSSVLAVPSEHKIASNQKTVFLSHKRIKEQYNEFKNNFKALDNYLLQY